MKIRLFVLALLAASFLVASCESSVDPLPGSQVDAAELRSTAQTGQWTITYFFDTDSDETADFNGYVFTFSSDGSVLAENGAIQIVGSWSVTEEADTSMDDSPDDSDDVDFNLSFASPPEFAELTDDWDVVEYSDSIIRLTDVSGGNGGTDFLTFERN